MESSAGLGIGWTCRGNLELAPRYPRPQRSASGLGHYLLTSLLHRDDGSVGQVFESRSTPVEKCSSGDRQFCDVSGRGTAGGDLDVTRAVLGDGLVHFRGYGLKPSTGSGCPT